MKHVKTLGLAAVAAAALMAFAGAGTASAETNLCSTTTTPCTSEVPAGTVLDFSLAPGTSAKQTTTDGKTTLQTCTASTIKMQLATATPPTGPITELTWGTAGTPCTFPAKATQLSNLAFDRIVGTDNALITADGEIKLFTVNTVLFGSCVYGVTSGTQLGTFTGGKPAAFDLNAVAKKLTGSEAACPETSKVTASYVLTEPKETTIHVEA